MITPRTIKTQLAGQSFSVRSEVTGADVVFEFPSKFDGWPRSGSEAIVTPVICRQPGKGSLPSIFKFFIHPLPVRRNRQAFLIKSGLAGVHEWLYEGLPYAWIDETVAGVRVSGQISKDVRFGRQGDDFRILRQGGRFDAYTLEQRKVLAAQLCIAIVGLEKLGITHGDLSPANIVVSKVGSDESRCVLIDYDGFQAGAVPVLPRQVDGRQVRMLGSPGYQHPSLLSALKADDGLDDALRVANDRFALGVLCFELVTWQSAMMETVGRQTILSENGLENSECIIPQASKDAWENGAKLLQRAVEEKNPESLPSPLEWLKALGFLENVPVDTKSVWLGTPMINIYQKVGNQSPGHQQLVHFQKDKGVGVLSAVHPDLAIIGYDYETNRGTCAHLRFSISTDKTVLVKWPGQKLQVYNGVREITVGPGVTLMVDGWVIEVSETPTEISR